MSSSRSPFRISVDTVDEALVDSLKALTNQSSGTRGLLLRLNLNAQVTKNTKYYVYSEHIGNMQVQNNFVI